MIAALAVAALALRAGLGLRRARTGRARAGPGARARHVRFAKPAVVLVLVGFAGGPVSMALLRDRAPFDTMHALLGAIAAALFATCAVLGRRLERGRSRSAETHGLLGLAAMLAAAAAAVAGFVLLP